ncbi:MAG: restriction endonuclease subunit S [Alphaproteobacteria bacterium]|nr:restriction endonuclease subunit S [Alphaproteobacteria bacterium]
MPKQLVGNTTGWTNVAFGEVVRKINDKVDPWESGLERYVAGEHLDTDDLRIRRWGLIGDDYLGPAFHMRFKPGQVLYGSRRTYLRKVALADFEGITANTTYVLEPKDSDVLMPDLLPFIMQTGAFHAHSISRSKGSVNPYVNFSDIACFEFMLPPIQEQPRLVEVLTAARSSVERLLSLLEATRIAQTATFQTLVSGNDAKTIKLGDLMTTAPRNGYSPVAAPNPTGHWVLALSAIFQWGYRSGQLKPVAPSAESTAALIRKGDLVVSRSNTRDLVGLPMVFPEDRSDVSYPDTMMRISVDPNEISREFLELCLRIPDCRRQVQSYAAGTSSSMLKINGTNLRKVEVPFISIENQRSILVEMTRFAAMRTDGEKRFNSAREFQNQLANEASILGAD